MVVFDRFLDALPSEWRAAGELAHTLSRMLNLQSKSTLRAYGADQMLTFELSVSDHGVSYCVLQHLGKLVASRRGETLTFIGFT